MWPEEKVINVGKQVLAIIKFYAQVSELYRGRDLVLEKIPGNQIFESKIPSLIKRNIKGLLLPITMMTNTPEKFFFSWIHYDIMCPVVGKILAQGKTIQGFKPISIHLSCIFGTNEEEEKVLINSIAIFYLFKFCNKNYKKFFSDNNEEVKKLFDDLWDGMCQLWKESGSLKSKIYKQIMLPFIGPSLLHFIFTHCRFYNPTVQFLKNAPILSYVYRYIEWVHNRPTWAKNKWETFIKNKQSVTKESAKIQ